MRNHNTVTRDKLIPELAKCVPEGHIVALDNPELFVLVEIFKVSLLQRSSSNEAITCQYRAYVASVSSKTTTSCKSST